MQDENIAEFCEVSEDPKNSQVQNDSNPDDLKRVKDRLLELEIQNQKKEVFNCYICDNGETFLLGEHLKVHFMSKHPGLNPFKCSLCDKAYTKNANLRTHFEKRP